MEGPEKEAGNTGTMTIIEGLKDVATRTTAETTGAGKMATGRF
jgi:hypothetical protein